MFPQRFITARPEGYEELVVPVWANPTGAQIAALLTVGYPDQTELIAELEAREPSEARDTQIAAAQQRQAHRQTLGAALVASYGGGVVTAYGHTFDLSTPASAVDVLFDEAIPEDLRWWLRNAAVEVPGAIVAELGKSYAWCSGPGTLSTTQAT